MGQSSLKGLKRTFYHIYVYRTFFTLVLLRFCYILLFQNEIHTIIPFRGCRGKRLGQFKLRICFNIIG